MGIRTGIHLIKKTPPYHERCLSERATGGPTLMGIRTGIHLIKKTPPPSREVSFRAGDRRSYPHGYSNRHPLN